MWDYSLELCPKFHMHAFSPTTAKLLPPIWVTKSIVAPSRNGTLAWSVHRVKWWYVYVFACLMCWFENHGSITNYMQGVVWLERVDLCNIQTVPASLIQNTVKTIVCWKIKCKYKDHGVWVKGWYPSSQTQYNYSMW